MSVKELLLMKGRVEAYLSIFSMVCSRMDNPMLDVFIEYGGTLIAPLNLYVERLSPLSPATADIIQRRLSDVRHQFVEVSKGPDKDGMLKVFEQIKGLYDDLELVLTTVEDIRRRSRSSKLPSK